MCECSEWVKKAKSEQHDNNFLTEYISYFCEAKCKLDHRLNQFLAGFNILSKYLIPTSADQMKIYNISQNIQDKINLFNNMLSNNVKLHPDLLRYALTYYGRYDVAKYLLKYIEPTDDMLLLLEADIRRSECFDILIEMLKYKLNIPESLTNKAIINADPKIFDLLVNFGASTDKNHLTSACSVRKLPIVKRLLELGVKPDKRHFSAIFKDLDVPEPADSKYYRRFYKWNNDNSGLVNDIVNLLIEHGYKLSTADFYLALKTHCILDDKHTTKLKLDSKIYSMSAEEKHPYRLKKFDGVDADLKALQKICKKGTLKDVKFILNNFTITPDSKCLEMACRSGNIKVIDLLMKNYDVKPTAACLEYLIKSSGTKTMISVYEAAKKAKITIE